MPIFFLSKFILFLFLVRIPPAALPFKIRMSLVRVGNVEYTEYQSVCPFVGRRGAQFGRLDRKPGTLFTYFVGNNRERAV